ncbi:hypothetical protein ACO0E1_03415 [Curtobacterium sp. RRHDQ66]|uniref:hypothetical protein n=1 Tax=Curtobacterium guangdongense TaxID=3413380 RepID=UPI003BF3D26C
MDAAVRDRWIALAAVVAALAPALSGFAGLVTLTQWDPGTIALRVGAVVGGLAAVVVGWVAWRRSDRTTLGFALAVLCFALSWVPLGALSFPVSTILSIASEALLIAFGVVVLRRSTGATRIAGWVIAVAAAVWLLGGLAIWLGTLPQATQTMLTILFTTPAVAQIVAFLAAAALFVGPLLRPVRAGARYLWTTADVR